MRSKPVTACQREGRKSGAVRLELGVVAPRGQSGRKMHPSRHQSLTERRVWACPLTAQSSKPETPQRAQLGKNGLARFL